MVGRELGLPEADYQRPPFPGPGLSVRVLGEVTRERLATVRQADAIVCAELAGCGAFQYMALLHQDKVTGIRNGKRLDDARHSPFRHRLRHRSDPVHQALRAFFGLGDSGRAGPEKEVRIFVPGSEVEAVAAMLDDRRRAPATPESGDKPPEEVVRIIDENCGLLVSKGAKLIVLACNSASTWRYSMPRPRTRSTSCALPASSSARLSPARRASSALMAPSNSSSSRAC